MLFRLTTAGRLYREHVLDKYKARGFTFKLDSNPYHDSPQYIISSGVEVLINSLEDLIVLNKYFGSDILLDSESMTLTIVDDYLC